MHLHQLAQGRQSAFVNTPDLMKYNDPQARFMFEPLQALWIVGKSFRQNLDGDNSIQAGVDGAIDLAHPACAQIA
jgi:hypothetical protein